MRPAALASCLLASLLLSRAASAQVVVYEKVDPEGLEGGSRKLELYGFAQPRFTYQQKDKRDPNNTVDNSPGFSFARARLGSIARYEDIATLQFEIETQTASVLGIDAFARLHPIKEAQLQIGQFRVPFSRQNLIQGFTLQMPDPAYWVNPKFVVDRDIGAQVGGEALDGRITYAAAMMNGNKDPARTDRNFDDYFLYAGRVTVAPLGAYPRFEGDLRSDEERAKPLFYAGGGAMHNHLSDTHYKRLYIGADAGFLWQGFSLYGEFYQRKDTPDGDPAAANSPSVLARGFNVQAGLFPPVPYAREHFEVVGRFQQLDPDTNTKSPPPRDDLTASNPVQGFRGIGFGLNWFARRNHTAKVQVSYELRSELKKCLAGQAEPNCTGFVKNDLLIVQATVAF
jgi:hypothetical protein